MFSWNGINSQWLIGKRHSGTRWDTISVLSVAYLTCSSAAMLRPIHSAQGRAAPEDVRLANLGADMNGSMVSPSGFSGLAAEPASGWQ